LATAHACATALGRPLQTPALDLSQPFRRISVNDAFVILAGFSIIEALTDARLTDDFRCAEGWRVDNQAWEGVSLAELLHVVQPLSTAHYAEVSAAGYSVAVPLLAADASGAEGLTPTRALLANRLNGDALLKTAEEVGGVTVVVTEVPGVESNLMRQLIDQVRGKVSTSAVLLASRSGDDKVTLVAGISKDLQARKLSAGEWIRPVAEAVGGGGGGRPDLAQAGGKLPAKLPEALQIAKNTIRTMLGA
jgi:hypothetical protein